jgi:hypothetical protein
VQKFAEKFSVYTNSYEVVSAEFYKLSGQLKSQYEEVAATQRKMAE